MYTLYQNLKSGKWSGAETGSLSQGLILICLGSEGSPNTMVFNNTNSTADQNLIGPVLESWHNEIDTGQCSL